jgi:hypothetical protein
MKKFFLALLIPLLLVGGGIADIEARDRRVPIAAIAGDPFWANVVLSACNETGKADGNTTWDDQSDTNHTIAIEVGTPQWDTAQFVNATMGAACLFDGSNDALSVASHADFAFAGDFTIELYARFSSLVNFPFLFTTRQGTSDVAPGVFVSSTGYIAYFTSGADVIESAAGLIVINTWYHLAVSKVSGTTRLFIDGTQVGSNYTDGNSYVQGKVWIGTDFDGSNDMSGWMSNLRITKAGRYGGNFTPPTPPFPQN